MTQAKTRLTFEEYANLDAEDWVSLDLPESRCEYVAEGELNELPSESEFNDWIALFLRDVLVQFTKPRLLRPHSCEIAVIGTPKTRFPDLVVLQQEHINLTQRRLFISLDMPPPQVVVEVVSPGDDNEERDYKAKLKQYQARGIPEYWLIDPHQQLITVLSLEGDRYGEVGIFRGGDRLQSLTFPALNLTAHQIFTAGEEA